MSELLLCPFCGHRIDAIGDDDVLYPSGGYWRDEGGYRSYWSHRERKDGDSACWGVHCPVTSGGCGANITADSRDEVIAAWNRRVAAAPKARDAG